jgi:hypothetical protein
LTSVNAVATMTVPRYDGATLGAHEWFISDPHSYRPLAEPGCQKRLDKSAGEKRGISQSFCAF